MALSTGWTSQDRLAPIAVGLVPAHLRPLALGDTPPKSSLKPKRVAKPAYIPPQLPADKGRPPRQRKLRVCNVEMPPAPGVPPMFGGPIWTQHLISEATGMTALCRDRHCRRGRACLYDSGVCWRKREMEERLARMSETRRAGLYRHAVALNEKAAELLRALNERAQSR